MIDVGQLERAVNQAPGNAIVVSKDQLAQMFDEMRRGQAATRALVNMRSLAGAGLAAGQRVPGGYKAPTAAPTP